MKMVESGNSVVSNGLSLSEEVRKLCNVCTHYEGLKMNGVDALSEDNHYTTVNIYLFN